MAELPELEILRAQMSEALSGKSINLAEVLQEKCLNVPVDGFCRGTVGRTVSGVGRVGKWLVMNLDSGDAILLNPGMGFDLWYYAPGDDLPGKYQLRIGFDDGCGLTCRFWWFGHIRLVTGDDFPTYPDLVKLGPDPMGLTLGDFMAIAAKHPRKPAKAMITDQGILSGIGNAYSHDILWSAGIHPARKLGALTPDEYGAYHAAVLEIMRRAIRLGGIEDDFYRKGGNHRNWEDFGIIGYKEGKPCPRCSTPIEKIKTGATGTFICPVCQPLTQS